MDSFLVRNFNSQSFKGPFVTNIKPFAPVVPLMIDFVVPGFEETLWLEVHKITKFK